jgi:hypothetical protein
MTEDRGGEQPVTTKLKMQPSQEPFHQEKVRGSSIHVHHISHKGLGGLGLGKKTQQNHSNSFGKAKARSLIEMDNLSIHPLEKESLGNLEPCKFTSKVSDGNARCLAVLTMRGSGNLKVALNKAFGSSENRMIVTHGLLL